MLMRLPLLAQLFLADLYVVIEELLILIGKIPIILNRLTVVENENTVLKDNFAKLQSESDAYKSEYIKLQHDFTALKQQSESEYKGLQSELTTFKVKCEGRHNDDAQYSRRNSLLLKKLRNVPKNCHGTNFSKFVAREINRLLPELSMSVTHHHIDASHPLNNENMNSPIVVKFVSRDLRNEIYNARNFITDPHVTISEHLTPQNHTLLTKAQDATSYEDAWSNQGKIYMKLEGSTKRVNSLSDIPPKATGSNHDASRYKRHRKSASTNYQKGRTFYKKAGNFPRLNYNNQSRYHHNRNSNNSYDNNNYDYRPHNQFANNIYTNWWEWPQLPNNNVEYSYNSNQSTNNLMNNAQTFNNTEFSNDCYNNNSNFPSTSNWTQYCY